MCYICDFNNGCCSRNRYREKWYMYLLKGSHHLKSGLLLLSLEIFKLMNFIGRVQKVSGLVITFYVEVIFFQEIRIVIKFNLISIYKNNIV